MMWIKLLITCVLFLGLVSGARASYPAPEPCYAWITKRDIYSENGTNYEQVTIALQNNGSTGMNRAYLDSDLFTNVNSVCPLGFDLTELNTHSIYCNNGSREIAGNEYLKIKQAYTGGWGSGSSVSATRITTDYPAIINYNQWNNKNNMLSADNVYSDSGVVHSGDLYTGQAYYGFGNFNIPAGAIISNIAITIKGYTSNSQNARQFVVYLSKNGGTSWQTPSPNNDLMWVNPPDYGSVHTYNTNSNSAQWPGMGWTPGNFVDNNFVVALIGWSTIDTTFYADYINVAITYLISEHGIYKVYVSDGTNKYQCLESAMGTLQPDFAYSNGSSSSSALINPQVGQVLVPQSCGTFDLLCQLKVWLYSAFNAVFGFDEEYSQAQYDALSNYADTKIPFIWVNAIDDIRLSFWPSEGSPSATLPDFDLSFTPKKVQGGVTSDLTPVSVHVPGETFSPVQPFVTLFRGAMDILLKLSLGFFIIYIAWSQFI